MTLKHKAVGLIAILALAVSGFAQEEQTELQALEERLMALEERIADLEAMFGQRLLGLEQRIAMQQAIDRARRDLEGVRAGIEAQEDPEGGADILSRIREDLGFAFLGTEGETLRMWIELRRNLQTLEEQVRAGDAAAMETYEAVLQGLDMEAADVEDADEAEPVAAVPETVTDERPPQEDFWFHMDPADFGLVLVEAERHLLTLQPVIEAGRAGELVAEELGWMRAALENAFGLTEPEAQERWNEELRGQFEMLEEQVRGADPAAVETHATLLEGLREAIQAAGIETEIE